jgi:fatty-acyl-CoA synthase
MREPSLYATFESRLRAGASVEILGETSTHVETRTHEEMLRSAALRATSIAEQGVGKGEVVGIFARTTFDFLIGCLAIWRRGAVVMPLAPPARLVSREAWENRIHALLAKAEATAILAAPGDPELSTHVPRLTPTETGGAFADPHPESTDVALIQFSSGSTSAPKGIVLEHGALLANLAATGKRECPFPPEKSRFFSWLPFSHDMGLINYFLMPFSKGGSMSLLPTELFVRSPLRWLDELTRFQASVSSAPNFAFGLAARELEKDTRRELDLSPWQYAGNGGEIVSAAILERFAAATQRHGFDPGSLVPGYGLAEATCTVTAHSPGEGWTVDHIDRSELAAGVARPGVAGQTGVAPFVSVGTAIDNSEVIVVDEMGAPLEERVVGEVLVKGPGVMRGYLSDPEATAAVFVDGWLKTGDRGYLVDGRLYVTGRSKDTIIVGGQNYYAEDVERVVQRVKEVRPGNAIAVATMEGGAEGLAVIAETGGEPSRRRAIREQIAHEVTSETGIAPSRVLLLPARSVPKTTSGKLQRQKAKQMLEQGAFTELEEPVAEPESAPSAQRAPSDPLEHQLLGMWRSVLEVEEIDTSDDFFLLGGSSVQAASILSMIEERYGRDLPLSVILKAPTVKKLAAVVREETAPVAARLVPLQVDTGGAPFFCVHGGGGHVFHLLPLAHRLAGRRSFYGLQARGSDGTEAPHGSVEEMASEYIAEMMQIHRGPYLLLGYSFGGVVAYEMAAQLHRAGEEVALVGLLDAPSIEDAGVRSPLLDRSNWKKGPRSALRYARNTVERRSSDIKNRVTLARQKALPSDVVTDFLIQNSGKVMAKYSGGGYPGPVHYFRVVDPGGEPMATRSEGWGRLVGERLRMIDIEAPNHVEFLQEPWVKSLADALVIESEKTLESRSPKINHEEASPGA